MKHVHPSKLTSLALAGGLVFASFQASPEDIDIFSVDTGQVINKPNVIIVLDNSANWSRQAQQWPGGLAQGQSEVRAIKEVLQSLPDNSVNVGLLLYSTDGNAAQNDGGYIRYHVRPMTGTNKAEISTQLDVIFNNIEEPIEKRSTGNPFGDLMWDTYNYLAGITQSKNGAGTPASRAHAAAYTSNYDRFRSPLTSADTCTRTILIFLGNNVSAGPTGDSAANVAALHALATQAAGGDSSAGDTAIEQIPFADYVVQPVNEVALYKPASACYPSVSACTAAENNTACTGQGFNSCFCDGDTAVDCTPKQFTVFGTPYKNELTSENVTVTSNAPTGEIGYCQNNDPGAYTCPGSGTATSVGPGANQTTVTHTSWANCTFQATPDSCGPNNNHATWTPVGDRTDKIQIFTRTVGDVENLSHQSACHGGAALCTSADFPSSCNDGAQAEGHFGCYCDEPSTTSGCPAAGFSYSVMGNFVSTQATATGTFSAPPTQGGKNFMMDEWARFLRQTGVPLPDGSGARNQITTYTIDVFNKQQHQDFSALLFNAARVGGGKYYQAKNEQAIKNALLEIFTEVQAVNSAFSSASLPVSATNRAQNENQVFMGLFRPDRTKKPLWFGNLKRYQLIESAGVISLGDKDGSAAINNQTGFISDCATSFWSTDSGDYWARVITDDPDARGLCGTSNKPWSDAPDGPFVEKGAVAQVLRQGNNPSASPDADGNYELSRNVKTVSGGSFVPFTNSVYTDPAVLAIADPPLTKEQHEQRIVDFIRGHDVLDDDNDASTTRGLTEPRSTIHGDVLHSRPLPVNYGGSDGVVVFYGANDGTFRAVNAETGVELWSLVAPEHFTKLRRLFNNAPAIRFFGDLTGTPKDYFFDGPTGVFQKADNSKVWIFPTMRRGGRKIYAIDVTDPNNPVFKWSRGCHAGVCDPGFENIGQTWALPQVAFIKGYSETNPVIVLGGGYSSCEDSNTPTPACGTQGSGVYVIDMNSGSLLRHFSLGGRGVAADVALLDIDQDGMVDYGYAVDLGGNIYRMDFVDGPLTRVGLDPTGWRSSRVAYTNEPVAYPKSPRKFEFPPALLQATSTTVYLALGSGDREHPLMTQYPYTTPILNRFYVFKDDLSDIDSTTATDLDNACPPDFDASDPGDDLGCMVDQTKDNDCDAPRILPSSAQAGWFIDLNEHGVGEQTVTAALIAAGFVVFSTNRPTETDPDACTNSLGEARGYFVNLLNGSGAVGVSGACGGDRSGTFVGGGLPPSPVLATVPIDGELRTVVIGAVQKSGAPSSPIEAQRVRPPITARRTPIYWYKSSGDN
jgi:Tfp pilus tip-associated adhesin PilY1